MDDFIPLEEFDQRVMSVTAEGMQRVGLKDLIITLGVRFLLLILLMMLGIYRLMRTTD